MKRKMIVMLTLGTLASAAYADFNKLPYMSMPYESASCEKRMSIEQTIFTGRFKAIKSKMIQINLLTKKVESLLKEKIALGNSLKNDSRIAEIENEIDKKLEEIFQIELKVESEKKKLHSKLTTSEKELVDIDNSYVMSEDCKTMYVLPPKYGNATIMAASFLGGINLCNSYDFYDEMISDTKRVIRRYSSLISQTEDEVKMATLNKYQRLERKELNELLIEKGEIGKNTAFNSNILFESRWNELIRKYQERNSDINVVKMPITNSKLRVVAKNSSSLGEQDNYNGVSFLGVPGIDMNGPGSKEVFFNGSKAALVQLNLHAACGLKKIIGSDYDFANKTIAQVNKDIANLTNSVFAADVEFSYPVSSKKGYKITINQENFRKFHRSFLKEKFKHDAKTIYDEMFKNDKESIVKIEIYNQSTDVDDIDEEYVLNLKDKVQEKILNDYLREVATPAQAAIELAQQVANPNIVTLPEENWEMVTRKYPVCRKVKKSVLGIVYSSKKRCWNRAYKVKEHYKVSSSANSNFETKFISKLTEEFQSTKTINRKATMSFIRKGI
jgi:hypothetical protein